MKNAVFVIILAILIFLMPDKREPFNPSLNFTLSVLYLIALVYFLFIQSRNNKNWLRFDVLFLLSYTIVHFQIPFLASIGIEPSKPSFVWINKQVVNFATWMGVLAINLWMLGFNLASDKVKYQINNLSPKPFRVNFAIYDVLLAIFFVGFLILVGSSFFTGEVQGTDTWGGGAVYIHLIFSNLLCLRIIYFVFTLPQNCSLLKIINQLSRNKIFSIILFMNTFLFLISGDRGPVLDTILIAGGAYALFIKPIKLNRLIFFILIGAFIFSMIGLGRGERSEGFGEKNILERGYAEFLNNEDVNITNELASSIRIQYRALDVVPDAHPYLYGSTFLFSLTNAIPFGGSLTRSIFDLPLIYTDSSLFFTYLGQGNWSTWGEGSEILADIYINFGLIGIIIIFFFFGIFSKKIAEKASTKNLQQVIIYMAFMMSVIYINRSHILYPLKDVVYMLFLNYIFTKVIK